MKQANRTFAVRLQDTASFLDIIYCGVQMLLIFSSWLPTFVLSLKCIACMPNKSYMSTSAEGIDLC